MDKMTPTQQAIYSMGLSRLSECLSSATKVLSGEAPTEQDKANFGDLQDFYVSVRKEVDNG